MGLMFEGPNGVWVPASAGMTGDEAGFEKR